MGMCVISVCENVCDIGLCFEWITRKASISISGVSEIPANHHQDFILYYDSGINKVYANS